MEKVSKCLNEAVKRAEERIREERQAQDRADWEGNHLEDRR